MPSAYTENNERVGAAIAAGQRLHLGVTLSYCGGSSDKFWSAVWARNRVAVNYGRHGHQGQFQFHSDIHNDQQAAAKLWTLLRSKVGKGYAVVDGSVLALSGTYLGNARSMVQYWDDVRDARHLNPKRPMNHPELLGISPRNATHGAAALLAITEPHPTRETMIDSAIANPTERFLPPIIMSRPDVPDEAKFLAALGGATVVM